MKYLQIFVLGPFLGFARHCLAYCWLGGTDIGNTRGGSRIFQRGVHIQEWKNNIYVQNYLTSKSSQNLKILPKPRYFNSANSVFSWDDHQDCIVYTYKSFSREYKISAACWVLTLHDKNVHQITQHSPRIFQQTTSGVLLKQYSTSLLAQIANSVHKTTPLQLLLSSFTGASWIISP